MALFRRCDRCSNTISGVFFVVKLSRIEGIDDRPETRLERELCESCRGEVEQYIRKSPPPEGLPS